MEKDYKFSSKSFKLLMSGIPFVLSLIFLVISIVSSEYLLLVFCPFLWIIAIMIYVFLKKQDDEVKEIIDANESIKNYKEEIIIDLTEYVVAHEYRMKNGKKEVPYGKFLEINKSNEIFKKGNSTIGTITKIIDEREMEMIVDNIHNWKGHIYLVVEFKNNEGRSFKVKTPAIRDEVGPKIAIGKEVKVYFDDSKERSKLEVYEQEGKNRVKYLYDDIDFYVTELKK